MNRSILIVICDFLLVSLVTFSSLDLEKAQDPRSPEGVHVEILTNQVSSRQDLGEVMKIALDEERRNRDLLAGQLAQTRDSVARQQEQLGEREKQIDEVEQKLQSSEEKGQKLQETQAKLEQQMAAAQGNIQSLNQQLQSNAVQQTLTKEALAATEAEAHKQLERAVALQQQLGQVEKSNQVAASEQQRLSTQLQVAEAEKRLAAERVARMQEEVKIEKEEKARLTEVANKSLETAAKSQELVKNSQDLASKSTDLAQAMKQEFHDNQPLAANLVFNAFLTNRIHSHFTAYRPVFLGIDSNKRKESESVLVTDGTSTFALCHVQDTAFTLWSPGTDWEALTGTLSRGMTTIGIPAVSFYLFDPRVVLIPVTKAQAQQLGGKPYRIAADPLKFPDAVVVGTRENYYGEVKFQIEFGTPQYLKMDHNTIKGIFGKFNPSSGDLVLSKTGELLGVMVNNTYCSIVKDLKVAATVPFGLDVKAQHTGQTLALLYSMVQEQPLRVQ